MPQEQCSHLTLQAATCTYQLYVSCVTCHVLYLLYCVSCITLQSLASSCLSMPGHIMSCYAVMIQVQDTMCHHCPHAHVVLLHPAELKMASMSRWLADVSQVLS